MLLGDRLPVVSDLAAGGELVGPVGFGLEGRLVDVGGDVATDAGVGVFEPGAALLVRSRVSTYTGGRHLQEHLILGLTKSSFFSKMVSWMLGTLAGSKMPAVIPARPPPMTATLRARGWSMKRSTREIRDLGYVGIRWGIVVVEGGSPGEVAGV